MVKGQKVVCIDDKFGSIAEFYTKLPVEGSTYTIRQVSVGVNIKGEAGEVCLHLQEIINPKSSKAPFPERGFSSDRFRLLTEEESYLKAEAEERKNVFVSNIVPA